MELSCPVTHGYLRALRNLYDFESVQFEMWQGPLDDAIELANHVGGGRKLEHQRAFYCVELMTTRLYIQSGTPAWLRSREGLNRLLRVTNAQRDDLLARITEFTYLPGIQDGAAERRNDMDRITATTLGYVCEAAELLRQSLKSPDVHLSRVGKRLALAANAAGFYVDRMLELANELINYNEGNARRAWEPRRM